MNHFLLLIVAIAFSAYLGGMVLFVLKVHPYRVAAMGWPHSILAAIFTIAWPVSVWLMAIMERRRF